jgi:single-stranded-DNA-specific exonuclease
VLRGSGRSIPGLHLRDCLDLVAKRAPDLIRRFGGHAQAAGLTIAERDFERFALAFERAAAELIPPDALARVIETDGALESGYFTLETARMLDERIWGQGFPAPVFCDTFVIENQRVVGDKHLKLRLEKDGRRHEAIFFNAAGSDAQALAPRIRAAYRLSINEYNGLKSVQLTVEYAESA